MAVHLLCLLLIFQVKQCFAWLPKIIWTYWSTPLNSSQISVLLPAFQQNHLRNTQGWQLRHIDSYSMWKWAEEIPNFKAVYNSPEWIGESEAKKSDLLRIALINHFGGLYMDFTTILTQNMDWILDIRTIESIQNKNGKQPDIFLLYSSEHGYKEIYLESGSGQRYLLLPTFESFLMAGKPGNQFCSDWLNFLIETKKLSFQKYKANNKKSMILDIAQSEKIQKGGYKTSYFQVLIAANIVLERKQRLFDLDWKTDLDNTRLLAVKYYNIWVMGTNASAYLGLNFDQETSVLAQIDINFLKQMKLYPPYFLKLNRITMNKIQNFLIKKQQLVTNQTESSEKSSFIIETSLLKVHLLNQKYMKYYANEVIKKQLYLSLCKTEYFIVKVKQIHEKMQKDQIQNFVQAKKLKKQIQLFESSNIKDKSEIQNMKNKIKDYENQRIQLMNKLSEYNQNQKIPQRQQNCQYFNNFYLKMALVIEGIVIICLLILIWRKKTETQNKKNNNQVNLREYESFQLKKQIGDH